MGYRSDVAFATNFKLIDDDHLPELVKLADSIYYEESDGEHYVLFVIQDIKWGYCDDLEAWMKSLDEYKLVVVGEELDGNQIDGDLDVFEINISRSISYSEHDEFYLKEEFDNLKTDLNIPSKETIFRKIQDVYRAEELRKAQSAKESQPS